MSDGEKKEIKNIGFQAAKKWLTRKPQEIYKEFLNTGRTLLGIYNINNKEIILIPCIKDRVVLIHDNEGVFIGGWKIHHWSLEKLEDISATELIEYNTSGEIPRFIILDTHYDPDNRALYNDKRQAAHDYLIQLKDLEKDIALYRGFAVTPGDKPVYAWTSATLNSPRDSRGNISLKVTRAEMLYHLQEEVMNIIGAWGTTGTLDLRHSEPLAKNLSSFSSTTNDDEFVAVFSTATLHSSAEEEEDMNFLDLIIQPQGSPKKEEAEIKTDSSSSSSSTVQSTVSSDKLQQLTQGTQFFSSVPEQKIPVLTNTPSIISCQILLEQAYDLLDIVCPRGSELRPGFIKQLAEYKQTGSALSFTTQQEHALQELVQTLREIQVSSQTLLSQTTTTQSSRK